MARADIHAAIFLVSLSSLAFEVLLTRVFSISQWNHLSFMVISIALFGFAASGVFLSILDDRRKGWEKRLSRRAGLDAWVVLYSVCALAAFIALNSIPLDYFRLPSEPVQIVWLLAAYLGLSVPFFLAGSIVSTGFAALPSRAGIVYFSTMSGSALGALAPIPLLSRIEEGPLLVLFAVVPLAFCFLPRTGDPEGARKRNGAIIAAGAAALAVAVFLCFANDGKWIEAKPSPYKSLAQTLKYPDSKTIESFSGIRGKVDIVESPYVRFAPGLSLQFHKALPKQKTLYLDADSPLALYDIAKMSDVEFATYSLPFAAYAAMPELSEVLVIQRGGGSAIAAAMASGAKSVTVAEQNRTVAKVLREHYGLRVVEVSSPAAFLADSKRRYSVIHLERWGPSLPGAGALDQDSLTTVDSVAACLRNLGENGMVAMTGKLLLPPSNVPRLWATAYEALRKVGKTKPGEHMAILRNWDMFVLIVSARPLFDALAQNESSSQGRLLQEFAERLNFDLAYLPGLQEKDANRFNVFDAPYYYGEIRRLQEAYEEGRESKYYEDCILDARPQYDSRPFPNRFLKWGRIADLYRATGSRPRSFLLSGELVVAAVFAEALFVAVVLLVLPMALASGKKKPMVFPLIFFLCVGAGFMFAEIFFIKKIALLFSSPAVGFTVVLSGMLVFSGVGGFMSQKMDRQALRRSLFGLFVIFCAFCAFFGPMEKWLIERGEPVRYLLSYLVLLPAGLLLGIPFSLGMRLVLDTAKGRAYAWAANGCASVLASVAAAQVAVAEGIPALALLAALSYLLALLACPMKWLSRH